MNIKKSLVSFSSIAIFILLAVSLFLGLSWGSQAIKISADSEFQNYQFHDFEIVCPYGLSDEQVDEFSDIEGIDKVEGFYKTYEFFNLGGETKQASIMSITTEIDLLGQLEGRLPAANNEILIEKHWAKLNGIKLEDTIVFEEDSSSYPHAIKDIVTTGKIDMTFHDEDKIDNLTANSFTVVGFAESPSYISSNAFIYGSSPDNKCPVNCTMYVDKSAFDEKSFLGFSSILLRSASLNESKYYEDGYLDGLNSLGEIVEAKALELTTNRYNQVKDAINASFYKSFIGELPEYYGTVLNRNQSASISVISLCSDAAGNLRYVLSISLYVIALLITYSVISRIVFEQSPLIGAKKALGFTNKEITLSYLMYAVSSAVIGIVVGILTARFIIEPIVLNALKNVFVFEASVMTFSVVETLVVSAIALVFVVVITLLSCSKNLKRDAISLLNDVDNKKMKKRWFTKTKLWNKISLFFKTIINNFFNDKMRVGATVIGITGITTLIVCGFNFVLNVSQSGAKHYADYQSFDTVVYFDETVDDAESNIKLILEEENASFAPVASSSGTIELDNGNAYAVLLFASDSDNFDSMYNLVSTDGVEGNLKDGFWMCEPIAANEGLNIGDTISYTDNNLGEKEVTVDGITKYYLLIPCVFMSEEVYENTFAQELKHNAYLVNTSGVDMASLNTKLEEVNGYFLTEDYKTKSLSALKDTSSSFVAMAGLFIVMSFIMAILVILNLLVTFIQSKKKELIILMINGYEQKDARRYIYLDTILLTIVGILLGIVLGTVIGIISVSSICCSSIVFPKEINFIAIAIGIVLTALLMLFISLIALARIKKFKLVDINS